MLRYLTAIVFLICTTNGFAQSFEVPFNYKLEVKEDYARYEKDMIDAAKWLVATPLTTDPAKHEQVGRFVFNWVNGSPTVNCELNTIILDFEKKNPGMLFVYMAGTSRYVLENNYSKDMRAKHRFALKAMIDVYKNSSDINKDKKMEKLIKAWDEDKMEEWMEKNLKVG